MAIFFITVVFLPHNSTVGKLRRNGLLSTSARSNRRHTGEKSKTMDIYSFFTNSWLVRQRSRSWITRLGKNRQKSDTRSLLLQCLLSGDTEPWIHGLRETIACIQVKRHDGTPRVVCWQGSRQNTQKSECAFRRSPIGRSKKNCVFIRPSMRTG